MYDTMCMRIFLFFIYFYLYLLTPSWLFITSTLTWHAGSCWWMGIKSFSGKKWPLYALCWFIGLLLIAAYLQFCYVLLLASLFSFLIPSISFYYLWYHFGCIRFILRTLNWIQVNHIECRRWTTELKQIMVSDSGKNRDFKFTLS